MTTAALVVGSARGRIKIATAAAFAWAAINAGVLAAAIWLDSASRDAGVPVGSVVHLVAAAVAVCIGSAVGASIAARFPRHPVGWLLLSALSLYIIGGTLQSYGYLAVLTHPDWYGGRAAAAVDQSLWLLVFGVVALLLLVFPSGHPPIGKQWRGVARGIAVVSPLAFAWGLVGGHPHLDQPLAGLDNPWNVSVLNGPVATAINLVLILGCLGLLVVSAGSVVVRYRAAERAERAQLKWMVVAGSTLPTTLLICVSIGLFSPGVGDAAGSIGFSVILIAVPLAVAVAMTRYQLFSVDRFVDSALVYLTLTALVTVIYAVIVLGSSSLLDDGGHRSPVAVAGATLLVGGVVAPLRSRLHVLVARRFHRRQFDAVRIIEDYVRRLRDEQASLSDLEPTLSRALGDPTLRLGLWHADTSSYLGTDGAPVEAEGSEQSVFHVVRDGAPVAALVHDPVLNEEPLLLGAVTRAAALPLDNGRLHLEVLARLEEVQASRQRIVMAAYEERRRLERDLHDGAQQRLVSLALTLRLARDRLDGESGEILDDAAAQLSAAVREVRELARGIHPATLTEEGLAAALESLADRTPLEVVVDMPDRELPEDVAAAAYFTACEALTNVVKHTVATRIVIRGAVNDHRLVLTVTDNGAGGAWLRPGGGLQGIADRVDALGGGLTVAGDAAAGTTVRAELPCGR